MTKDSYLLIRQKMIRQLSRKTNQRDALKEKNLSKEGEMELNFLSGQIVATENMIDTFDKAFNLPYQDKLIED